MNSSFFNQLTAILSEADEVHGLPKCKMQVMRPSDEIIEQKISIEKVLMISRLQTLMVEQVNNFSVSNSLNLQEFQSQIGFDIFDSDKNEKMITFDFAHRVKMIQRLIIEIVREVLPRECDLLGYYYFIREDTKLIRVPA
jgi:O-phosphoseryl-tRNA(Cys) synthetase